METSERVHVDTGFLVVTNRGASPADPKPADGCSPSTTYPSKVPRVAVDFATNRIEGRVRLTAGQGGR